MKPVNRTSAPVRRRAFLYVRQSETSGKGEQSVSLESQRHILKKCAEDVLGCVVVGHDTDADVRGWVDDKDRPGFRRIMERARAGEFDILVFYELSRLARSLRLQENIINELSELGIDYYSFREPQASDPMFRQFLGIIHESRTREISAHTMRAFAERARRGLHHAKPPYGYRRPDSATVVDPASLPLEIDEPRALVVRDIFRWLLDGWTVSAIRDRLNERRIPPPRDRAWTWTQVRRVLMNEAYRGAIEASSGVVVEGAHPAIIPPDEWHAAQAILADAKRPKTRKKPYESWLEGYIYHECGQRMYLQWRSGRGTHATGGATTLFRCRSVGSEQVSERDCGVLPRSRKAQTIEADVWTIVCRDLAGLIEPERAVAAANAAYAEIAPDAAKRRKEIERRLAALDARLARAEALYLDGERSREWMNEQESNLAGDRMALLAARDELPPAPDDDAIRTAHELLRDLGSSLPEMPDELRAPTMARLGVATFGAHGVRMHYWPEIAALIPDGLSTAALLAHHSERERPSALMMVSCPLCCYIRARQ